MKMSKKYVCGGKPKQSKANKFKNMLLIASSAAALASAVPGCTGYTDVGKGKDVGSDSESKDKQKCEFGSYAVLSIDGEKNKVMFGDSVEINGKQYELVKIGNGILLQADNPGDSVFFAGDSVEVNGVQVLLLGEGTTEINSAAVQVEYYSGSASQQTEVIGKGSSLRMDVDDKHYIIVSVNDVVRTSKVEYALLSADVYVESKNESGKFIVVKSEEIEAVVDNTSVLVVDEATSLKVGIDLLGTGSSYAKAVLNINGSDTVLGSGDIYGDNDLGVSVKVLSVLRADGMEYAKISLTANGIATEQTIASGQVIRMDVGEGRMFRLELSGTESTCE